jgi:hypothetical protein
MAIQESSLAYVVNTRRWLSGSSVEAWRIVDTIAIIAPARKAIEPIRSKER